MSTPIDATHSPPKVISTAVKAKICKQSVDSESTIPRVLVSLRCGARSFLALVDLQLCANYGARGRVLLARGGAGALRLHTAPQLVVKIACRILN